MTLILPKDQKNKKKYFPNSSKVPYIIPSTVSNYTEYDILNLHWNFIFFDTGFAAGLIRSIVYKNNTP